MSQVLTGGGNRRQRRGSEGIYIHNGQKIRLLLQRSDSKLLFSIFLWLSMYCSASFSASTESLQDSGGEDTLHDLTPQT